MFTVMVTLRILPAGVSLLVFWVIFVYFRVFSTVFRGGCKGKQKLSTQQKVKGLR